LAFLPREGIRINFKKKKIPKKEEVNGNNNWELVFWVSKPFNQP